MHKKRKVIFFLYLLVVLRLVVFKYPLAHFWQIVNSWEKHVVLEGLKTANFTPFRTINMYIRYSDRLNSFENLVGNVVIFIPFGVLMPYAFLRGRSFFALFSSAFVWIVGIEVFQLFSAFGAFDVDDILLNMVGAVTGYLLFHVAENVRHYIQGKKEDKNG